MIETERSPIKDKPLRHAGQSLEEERRALIADKLEPFLLLAGFLFLLACMEWWRYYSDLKPNPIVFSIAAAFAIALGVWRIVRLRPRFRALRLGIAGERAVGQFLERLRTNGYDVLHDIVAPGFNIDHVLVGPAGVFTIETKTWSKPVRGEAKITFDGERLVAGAYEPDRDPVIQARAQASWLKNLLAESTGRKVDVHPVVLFPGWFIEQESDSRRQVWILEPKALPAFLEREARRLEPADARLVAYHLSRYVRAGERERDQML